MKTPYLIPNANLCKHPSIHPSIKKNENTISIYPSIYLEPTAMQKTQEDSSLIAFIFLHPTRKELLYSIAEDELPEITGFILSLHWNLKSCPNSFLSAV